MVRTITLDRRHIYVLPNRYGMMMVVVLGVMLAASLNYGLSLGFVFTFWLTGICLVSIFHTYRNLQGLTLHLGEATPVFAGGTALFPVAVDNQPGPARHALSVAMEENTPKDQPRDVAANSLDWLPLACAAPRRGWLQPGRFYIQSTYPLGLVRGWSLLDLEGACLVYPAPEETAPPLPLGANREGEQGAGTPEGEDFQGLREYREGDSPRHIHWKTLARQDTLLVKQFGGLARQGVWLDFTALAPLDSEARLSRLCRWVLLAEQRDCLWGLRLPGLELPMAHGETHRQACLRALALYDHPQTFAGGPG